MNTAASNVQPFPTTFALPRWGAGRDGTDTPQRPWPAAPSRETDEVVGAPGTPAILFGAIAGGYAASFAAGWLAFVQAVPIV